MLYRIDNKCYVNIAPSIYVEVIIHENGDVESTLNKIEVNGNTKIEPTTLEIEIKKLNKSSQEYGMDRLYNKRKK